MWYKPSEKHPTSSCKIVIDCKEGIGDGFYKGKGVFHFSWTGTDLSEKDVLRWAYLPQREEDVFR